ncbi:glycosyltransferase family 2 protein, partial [Vibrio navarrensis]|nr:glycosyltransferase family 2 protein [Vibrio navarrensis]
MKISVIVAAYNQQNDLETCVNSVLKQGFSSDVEVLIIDDCSTDNTWSVIKDLSTQYSNVKGFKTAVNSGPGIARNIGIEHASGSWVLFLDSDDILAETAIEKLRRVINREQSNILNTKKLDIVAYDFRFLNSNHDSAIGRTDINALRLPKDELLNEYLSLKMDGSVIFTMMRKEFLDKHSIRFYQGYHEDVDFMFKVYAEAQRLSIIDDVIYIKNNRQGSIVNTISQKHIIGIFRAYTEIYKYLFERNNIYDMNLRYFSLGIVGVVATRIRQ